MDKHLHRWIIDPANGPTSQGICGCGESRPFQNSINASFKALNSESMKYGKERRVQIELEKLYASHDFSSHVG